MTRFLTADIFCVQFHVVFHKESSLSQQMLFKGATNRHNNQCRHEKSSFLQPNIIDFKTIIWLLSKYSIFIFASFQNVIYFYNKVKQTDKSMAPLSRLNRQTVQVLHRLSTPNGREKAALFTQKPLGLDSLFPWTSQHILVYMWYFKL